MSALDNTATPSPNQYRQPKNDLCGTKFGRLTVKNFHGRDAQSKCKWLCECLCGSLTVVDGYNLKSGNSKSCGCAGSETTRKRNTSHGQTNSPEWIVWMNMKARCYRPSHDAYRHYGGRGITVCERWTGIDGFSNFLADMGKRPPKHEIDRKDNDGNYEPCNCRWATKSQQANNTSRNLPIIAFGIGMTLAELSRDSRCEVSYKTLAYRICNGWDIEKAASVPVGRADINCVVDAFGETITVTELSRHPLCVVRKATLTSRIRKGIDPELAATLPIQPGKKIR
jgi:hypothetical protein